MSKRNTLGKNILTIGLGISLSKLMSVLLVGLYTAYLSAEDYGYYDLLFVAVSTLIPLITLQITDALYRHLLDSRDDTETGRSVTGAFAVVAVGLLVSTAAVSVVNLSISLRYGWLLPGYIITSVLLIFSQQTARGLRRNTVFSMSGVVYTGVMVAANIFFIIVLGMGAEALFLSIIIADVVSVLLIEFTVKVYRRVALTAFDLGLIKSMCRYSIPLLPNALVWWFLLLLCRSVIGAVLGTGAVGVFGISAKFPSLLMAVFNIFGLAWQESAITEYNAANRDEYYTQTFNRYMRLLLCSLLVLLSVSRWITAVLIGEGFSDAWLYIPFLCIGSIFSAFSQFYGTGYLSAKKTVGAFVTSAIGVGCGALCLFFILDPRIGLHAAALAQMVAYIVMFVSRVVHTRRFFRIRAEWHVFLGLAALAGIYTWCYFLADLRVEIAMLTISAVVFLIFNREVMGKMLRLATGVLKRKGGGR
jgi:O-antigen/teichoic acid export membrane protein